ncbi:MAG: 23S rRNA (guanosine(2251)-2'-O)-methyltransferase RlmB [Propionibacteriaceae bacterium]|jgi:23S rRNA (guanosine2251-2'-O)-methyltransferase|nr:23S rRNA (guanosine(2251)-2'-O)-methyltransferase RlmB [Propionibacteriaceae bacterium]
MAGNSQRKGAVRKRGRAQAPAGSGGRIRRGLEGKGPTPKAEDRPYHKAYRDKNKPTSQKSRKPAQRTHSSSDWIFGRNPVLEALQANVPVKQALVAEGVERDSRMKEILSFAAQNGIPFLQATKHDLDRITGGAAHQGVALRIPPFEYADPGDLLEQALERGNGVAVALDSVTDPHNLGAIVRSAAAFGAYGVIIPERRSAQMTAAAWKTSAGAAARLPVARAKNLNQVLKAWSKAGVLVVGLAGDAELPIEAVSALNQPVLIVVGSEGEGLSHLVRQNCDQLASIKITGMESLNASVAAAIALYELTREN